MAGGARGYHSFHTILLLQLNKAHRRKTRNVFSFLNPTGNLSAGPCRKVFMFLRQLRLRT